MTVLFRCRVDPKTLAKADRVTERLGTSTSEMVRVFLKQIARTGKVPVSLESDADDAVAGSWEQRAATLESFYDPSKTW
jgi:addiction module RelB/DinJ family antitoxin